MIVCARADTVAVAPGTSYDRKCFVCEKHVAIAPTGQAILKDLPNMQVICMICAFSEIQEDVEVRLAADPEEILAEIDSAIPNPYLRRK